MYVMLVGAQFLSAIEPFDCGGWSCAQSCAHQGQESAVGRVFLVTINKGLIRWHCNKTKIFGDSGPL